MTRSELARQATAHAGRLGTWAARRLDPIGDASAAIESIAPKIGCSSETLRKWVRRAERDNGQRRVPTSDDRARLKALERENRELRQANEILRKASAFFAQVQLDRPMKKRRC